MLITRRILRIPDELFRKILRFILPGAYIPLLFGFETWWIAAGFAVSRQLDFAGSLVVALYLVWCGIRTIIEATTQNNTQED